MTRYFSLALLSAGVLTANLGCCCLSQLCCQTPCGLDSADPCGGYCAGGGACDTGDCADPCCDESCCDDPCGGGCGGPGTCFPLLKHVFRSLGMCFGCGASGCGEGYWNDYYNDPPDACDPCDGCGNWVGASNCRRAPDGGGPHLAGEGDMMDGSPVFQAPPEPVVERGPAPIRSAQSRGRRPARQW